MQILSFSPEKFFTLKKQTLKSYPIKGTIKRNKNQKEDEKNIQILSNSNKDRAEHLMIVDLLRNDIGKISKFGSVRVNDLFSVKTFETIHHMETEIVGEIKSNILDDLEINKDKSSFKDRIDFINNFIENNNAQDEKFNLQKFIFSIR